jgi:hypothetical protein
MGTSVFSYHLRGCSRAKCLDALAAVHSPHAYVSQMTDKWVSVIDENGEELKIEPFEETASKVSKFLKADVILTGVYDDDATFFAAFHAGKLVDRCFSSVVPLEWHGQGALPGNPKRLSEAFPWWSGAAQLEAALKKKFKMEGLRLNHMVRAFGIPEHRAFTKIQDLLNPLLSEYLKKMPPDSNVAIQARDRLAYVEFKGKSK